jgi:hypothetical protein
MTLQSPKYTTGDSIEMTLNFVDPTSIERFEDQYYDSAACIVNYSGVDTLNNQIYEAYDYYWKNLFEGSITRGNLV